MTHITIPAAAIEAVTDLVLAGGFRLHPDEARAAFLAMIEAWPGASRESDQLGGNWHRLILPLTENPDAEA